MRAGTPIPSHAEAFCKAMGSRAVIWSKGLAMENNMYIFFAKKMDCRYIPRYCRYTRYRAILFFQLWRSLVNVTVKTLISPIKLTDLTGGRRLDGAQRFGFPMAVRHGSLVEGRFLGNQCDWQSSVPPGSRYIRVGLWYIECALIVVNNIYMYCEYIYIYMNVSKHGGCVEE